MPICLVVMSLSVTLSRLVKDSAENDDSMRNSPRCVVIATIHEVRIDAIVVGQARRIQRHMHAIVEVLVRWFIINAGRDYRCLLSCFVD